MTREQSKLLKLFLFYKVIVMKKITKKAARKDLTGISLASLKRKLARIESRLEIVERLLVKLNATY